MNYSALNVPLWSPVIQIGIIAILVLLANILRLKVPFVKKSLMPTAVLAGFLLLGLKYTRLFSIDTAFMEMLTYHCLGIGFIALALRVNKKDEKQNAGFGTAIRTGATIASTYIVQGITGLAISLLLAYTFMPNLFKAIGLLLAMGYGQGPGQGNNIGSTYESLGFAGGRSFGLAIAATGFLVACVVGVIYLNVGARKKKFRLIEHEDIAGSITIDTFQDENESPISHSIDRLSIQAALIFFVYVITYLVLRSLTYLIGKHLPGVDSLLSPMLWGFNFIFGTLFAFLVKLVMGCFRKANLMQKQYQNNYLLNRISGFVFDIMIRASRKTHLRDFFEIAVEFKTAKLRGFKRRSFRVTSKN